MIKVGDYLYRRHNYGTTITRSLIVRETKTQWVLERDTRVRKEGLRIIGERRSYSSSYYYYEETEALKNEYLTNGIFSKVLLKLDSLYSKRNHYLKNKLTPETCADLFNKVKALEEEFQKLLPEKESL